MRFIVLFVLFVLFYSCGGSRRIKSSIPVNLKDQHYHDLPKNIIRLYEMMHGIFVLEVQDKGQGPFFTHKINEEFNDSVVVVQQKIGSPHKDGYWLMVYQCLSSVPNAPIYTQLINLVEVEGERDTILLKHYPLADTLKLKDVLYPSSQFVEDLKLSSLKEAEKIVRMARHSTTLFKGVSNMSFDPVLKEQRIDFFTMKPTGIDFTFETYQKDSLGAYQVHLNSYINHLARRNVNINYLAEAED